ncbi:MAG: FMN-binding negative transcriptional regulator [Mesorhizobium sp.]|uniref:FMN-binding negative transcriptional regulator n=1 Tax=Mesorhizobium sp. TaxID=1871066 RepID=UPI001229AAA0|nr:FMN-binding negative transcriptional regulator [Mesorhizobium sp.]TIP72077.1 MAG: FMN-binding negative transcriptional regulator [Mesorhizobium sp.]TIR47650.1 MAG: FMN-binding negative transcriptional regulator [Mesorhizobium sp.]TJV96778.1 MAG: FMN-binding negative transcriptional regulator [Mesorhizobium sp.]
MYVPPHFAVPDQNALFDFIEKHPFGILITNSNGALDANHIPFELDRSKADKGVLNCHVARKNPVWEEVANGDKVLVVFRAADAYISPNWYPSKHEFHKQVPTWNYLVAHAHGRITVRDDERYVRRNVAKLTHMHEANQPAQWKMGDAPKDFIDAMTKAIVALEIEITSLVGKFKLSQNKELRDIQNAGETLTAQGAVEVGQAMLAAAAAKSQ